jgi:hypothetical protein
MSAIANVVIDFVVEIMAKPSAAIQPSRYPGAIGIDRAPVWLAGGFQLARAAGSLSKRFSLAVLGMAVSFCPHPNIA